MRHSRVCMLTQVTLLESLGYPPACFSVASPIFLVKRHRYFGGKEMSPAHVNGCVFPRTRERFRVHA